MAVRKDTAGRRTQEILQDILRDGKVSVNDLANQLNVSTTTVRRSLRRLQSQGLLRRRHGGAVAIEDLLYEPFRYDADFKVREAVRTEEKRRIGLYAAELVADGDVVGISAGTTTTQVARALKLRRVTIITNAVNVAMELARSTTLQVRLVGGIVSGSWFSVLGATATAAIAASAIDICFVGADGIDLSSGVCSEHPGEAAVNAAMIHSSRRKIVVSDHSKFKLTAPEQIAPLSDLDLIITDTGLSEELHSAFQQGDVEIIRV